MVAEGRKQLERPISCILGGLQQKTWGITLSHGEGGIFSRLLDPNIIHALSSRCGSSPLLFPEFGPSSGSLTMAVISVVVLNLKGFFFFPNYRKVAKKKKKNPKSSCISSTTICQLGPLAFISSHTCVRAHTHSFSEPVTMQTWPFPPKHSSIYFLRRIFPYITTITKINTDIIICNLQSICTFRCPVSLSPLLWNSFSAFLWSSRRSLLWRVRAGCPGEYSCLLFLHL